MIEPVHFTPQYSRTEWSEFVVPLSYTLRRLVGISLARLIGNQVNIRHNPKSNELL